MSLVLIFDGGLRGYKEYPVLLRLLYGSTGPLSRDHATSAKEIKIINQIKRVSRVYGV